jgi:hypothetical protein
MPAILIVIALLASGDAPAERRAAPSRPPAESEAPRRGTTVRWMPTQSRAHELALVARIEFALPVRNADLSLTIPAGLRLIEGPVALKVSAPADLSPVEVAYRFAIEGPVAANLIVALDAGGVHAEAAWPAGAPTTATPVDNDKFPPLERAVRN